MKFYQDLPAVNAITENPKNRASGEYLRASGEY